MGTCKCGSRTVRFTPGQTKKKPMKAATLGKGDKSKDVSARSKRLSAQAKIKAQKNAVPCNCSAS